MSHTYLFLGDSITDSQRLWLPETRGLGNGYVALLDAKVRAYDPDARVINKGHDGFTVPALLRFLTQGFPAPDADFISVLIGVNDVGVAMNTQRTLKELSFARDYERLLDTLCSRTNARLLCMGPFLFPYPRKYTLWMDCLREAEAAQRALAERMEIPFLPLQDRFCAASARYGYSAVTTDGIHLTDLGHSLLADFITPYLSLG
ncbi:MAG: GDSL-type esterase/lipase family protein [Eubacteriales bacterium]|nr:GDSL-type esterase/lipase family protein [Eubacteriales bacterium]